MANKIYDKEINKYTDWGGDSSTENLPVSGTRIQEFIKKTLEGKMGIFHYDETNNRYLVFADSDTRDQYLEDPTKNELILGTFDAPFNYEAEINLISEPYKAVQLGSTGNYVEFTFDTKNKQGASVGGLAIVTYTIIRNSTKKVITETHNSKTTVKFNLDEYLGEGTNTVIIGITDKNTLAATTVSVTYQVVNLTIEDEFNISRVYDLSTNTSVNMEVLFKVSGPGTKRVEWYIDGELLDFVKEEDEVVDTEVSRTKYIPLSNLQQGKHSLQLRAYSVVNGENFYTNTLYRDFIVYTGTSTNTIIGVAIEIPSKNGIIGPSDNVAIYNMEQYVPYSLRLATYSPTSEQNVEVNIYLDNDLKGSIASSNDTESTYTLVSTTSGNKTLRLVSGETEYSIPVIVSPTSMAISNITNGLEFDFNSVGRSNTDSNKDKWSYNGYTGTFSGFKWNETSGWVNNRLLMPSGTSFSVDYAPLDNNPTDTGKTIELEFSTLNVRDDDAVICDLRNTNGTGLLITATKVSLTSENGVTIETEFRSGENVRIAFVINRSSGSLNKGLSFIYTNGIISRGESWLSTDRYDSNKTIKFTASDKVEISLKAIRVYNTALTSDQILNNYILYRDSIEEMTSIYDRNDIYTEGTTAFNPDKMMSRVPVMIVTGDIPTLENTSSKDTQIMVDIDYYNMQDPTRNFRMENAAMRPQGTSSMGYPKKNFRIYTKKINDTVLYDYTGKIVKDKLYSFREGSQPVNCWCLKADYAESSGTHNTGIARLWNKALYNVQINGEYVCRTNAQKAAITTEYEYDVRTAIDGFPILLFYRKTKNDDLIFIGKYNFNNDKSTESVFGFKGIPGFDNSRMQCWEILNNGNDLALFKTADNFDTNWKDAFESRYPDTESPNTDDLKAFCDWMSTVTQEDFATQKHEHLNLYMMAAYYVYLMRYAAVDQFVKNAMFTSEDGIHFYYIHYDNDTINGLINTGKLRVKPTDDRQSKDESDAYLFAGHDSRLWNMLEADTEFMNLVRRMDNALYSAGISYINSIKIFDEEQADKWVERVYNQDAQYKYIGPYSEKGINNLFMLQGKRDLHRKWWLAKRFSIYDAKFVTGPYKSQAIEFKCINGTPANQQFTITSGYPMNYGYGVNDEPRETGVSLNIGDSHTFTTNEVLNVGDPVRIYGAPNIKALDLVPIANKIATLSLSEVYDDNLGTCLTNLQLGSDTTVNNEVTAISGLKQAKRLELIDIRGFKKLTSLDLSEHPYIKEVRASKSGISSILLAKGSPLSVLSLPSTVTSLTLDQHSMLSYSNITFDDIRTIKSINVKDCPSVSNNFDFIYNWFSTKTTASNECSLVMNNVVWNDIDTARLLSLKNLGTLKLKGRIKLVEVTPEQLSEIQEVFGNNVFDSSSELYIIAPPAVYLVGPSEVLEGSTQQYQCVVTGEELIKATFSIVSGSSSYISMSPSGLLTVNEGQGATSITIQVTAILTSTTVTKQLNIRTIARTYPTQSNTSIQGEQSLVGEETTYTIQSSSEVNGKFITEWTLEGMDSYAEIKESNNTSCVIRKLNNIVTAIIGTLTATIKKEYNNEQVAIITKQVQIVNENIAETDAVVCKTFYDAGLCANETYITKDEARLVTSVDLPKFPNRGSFTFNGFQYFTSVVEIPAGTFGTNYNLQVYCKSIIFPPSIKTIKGDNYFSNVVFNEGLESFGNTGLIIDSTNDVTVVIPNNLEIPINSVQLYLYNSMPKKFTLLGGKNVVGTFKGNINTYVSIEELNNITIEECPINVLFYRRENIYSSDNRINYVRDENISSLTYTCSTGGYFEDMSTQKPVNLTKVKDRVYIVENKVYYITVNITSNVEDADFTIEYTNQENESMSTVVKKGQHILPIKYGTKVKITPHDKANFIAPSASNTTVNSTLIQSDFKYNESAGIYIEHVNGTLYTKDEWTAGGFSNDDANGVAVVRPISGSFVIAKEESSSSLAWGRDDKIITGIVNATSQSEALLDNDGIGNTSKIIEQCNGYTSNNITGAPAAEYCANVTFPNNKKGYLGALGEWKAVYDNKTEINNILSLIGGTRVYPYGDYSTSTQFSSSYYWRVNMRSGNCTYIEKYLTDKVRAFCQLSNNQNT